MRSYQFNFDLLIYTRISAHSSNDIIDIHAIHSRVLGAVWGTRTIGHVPPVHICIYIAKSVPIRSETQYHVGFVPEQTVPIQFDPLNL